MQSTSSSSPSDSAFAFAGAECDRLGKVGSLRPDGGGKNKYRNFAYFLLSRLRAAIFKRQLPEHPARGCSCRSVPNTTTQIHRYADGSHGYYHLLRCASAMVCPTCGPAIRAQRAKEVIYAVRRLIEEGHTYILLTLTTSHTVADDLRELASLFQAACRAIKAGRRWQDLARTWAIRHSIRIIEVTDDIPDADPAECTGWHYHCHIIIFLERPPLTAKEGRAIEADLSNMWLRALDRVGLSASRAHGCRVDIPRTRNGVISKRENLKN